MSVFTIQVAWIALAAAVLAIELVARTRADIPRLGEFVTGVMGPRLGQWFVLAGWAWLGFHLFARSG